MNIRTTVIKKTRKDHYCNSCEWLRFYGNTSEQLFNEFDFTEQEKNAILKAEENGWKTPKGDSCMYAVGVSEGEFYSVHFIQEIHQICVKYELYDY